MSELWSLAWHRLNIISEVVGNASGRIIATLFYFTIMVPFGLGVQLFGDPLNMKSVDESRQWHEREPVATDTYSVRRQG